MSDIQVLALIELVCIIVIVIAAYMWQRASYDKGHELGYEMGRRTQSMVQNTSEFISVNDVRRGMGLPEAPKHKHRFKLPRYLKHHDETYLMFYCRERNCPDPVFYVPRWRYLQGEWFGISALMKDPYGALEIERQRMTHYAMLQSELAWRTTISSDIQGMFSPNQKLPECGHIGPYGLVCNRENGHEFANDRLTRRHGYAGSFWNNDGTPWKSEAYFPLAS